MVTARGSAVGMSPLELLDRVLALAGVVAPADSLRLSVPPPRDPFRVRALRTIELPR